MIDNNNIAAGLDLAHEIIEGDGPTMESMSDKAAVAEQLVLSNAFTWGQAATILGLSRSYIYKLASFSDIERTRDMRTSGGVAGKINVEDVAKIRYVRMLLEDTEGQKRKKYDARVRSIIRGLLEAGNSPSTLGHLLGVSKHTLYGVKAGRLWN